MQTLTSRRDHVDTRLLQRLLTDETLADDVARFCRTQTSEWTRYCGEGANERLLAAFSGTDVDASWMTACQAAIATAWETAHPQLPYDAVPVARRQAFRSDAINLLAVVVDLATARDRRRLTTPPSDDEPFARALARRR